MTCASKQAVSTLSNRRRMRAGLRCFCILAMLAAGATESGLAQQGFVITSASPLPPATAGSPYSFQFQASGGSPPFTWGTVSPFGPPPPGLSLSASGLLQGTPTTPGQFSFGVRVSQSDGPSAQKTFVLNVANALFITTQSPLPAGIVGQQYQTTLAASGGTPPYSWSLVVGAGGLPPGYSLDRQTGRISGITSQPGTFQFPIRVTDSQQAGVNKTFALSVVAGKPRILPDPPLPTAFVGETYAAQLTSSAGSAALWAIVAGALPPGLQISPQTGSITGTPTEPGIFVWTALMRDFNGANAIREYSIRVEGSLQAAPELDISPTSLSLSFPSGTQSATKGLRIRNTGSGAISVNIAASTRNGGDWLMAIPNDGIATAVEPLDVLVQADPARLGPGGYFGSLAITGQPASQDAIAALGETITVPVSMSISSRRQFLRLSLDGLTFTAVQGGGSPPPLSFDVINDGVDPMPFSVAVSAFPSAAWLQAPSSQTTINPRSRRPIVVQVNPGGLAPGVYFGLIEVKAPGAAGEVRLLTVVLNLLPAGSRPPPVIDPTGLLFTGTQGAATAGKTFRIFVTGPSTVGFTSTLLSEGSADLFTQAPGQGQVTPNQPLTITVQPNTAGLAAGVYRSLLVLTFADNTQHTIPLTLILGPGGGRTLTDATANADCPSALNVTIVSSSGGYTSYVDAPAFLRADVSDDCGQPFAEGAGRSVRAESGGQTVFLSHKESGTWEATLDFQTSGSQPIEVSAQDLVRGIIGHATIAANVQPQLAVRPGVFEGGVVHGASFAKPPLAPGSIISIFGQDLSTNPDPAAGTVTTLPLPELAAGTRVRVGTSFLPLFFSWTNQVNAGLPLALNPDSGPLSLVAFRGSLPSDPVELSMTSAHPGLFTLNASGSGEGIFQDIGFRLVSITLPPASNPNGRRGVKPGEPVIIYATGLGAVAPTVASGQPASVNPLSHVTGTVQLTIGGQPAVTDFKGLVPGFVSLYQINALVPGGLVPGNAQVILTVNGVSSPADLTLSIE